MILAIDFDGVIHDPQDREPGYRMGKPVPGAKEALEGLLTAGHGIIVHSVKAHSPWGQRAIYDWLRYFGFPDVDITAIKPDADAYIDDKAIRFQDWPMTLELVTALMEVGS